MVLPSGLTPMPRGRLPTGMVATTLSDEASMTVTLFERSLDTYTSGSDATDAAFAPSIASDNSAIPTRPGVIASPPSGREAAAALRYRRAERVEVLAAHVRQHRQRPEGPADLLPLARARHVQRLPQLMVPFPERQGLALVAVKGWRRLHERDEGRAVRGAGSHHRLAHQLDRGPPGPRGLRHRRIPPAPETAVQLTGAEALQLVMPGERPDPRRAIAGQAHTALADGRDAVRPSPFADGPGHGIVHAALLDGQQQDVGGGRVSADAAAEARHAAPRRRFDLGPARRPVAHHAPAQQLPLLDEKLGQRVDVHRHAGRHVEGAPIAGLVAQP